MLNPLWQPPKGALDIDPGDPHHMMTTLPRGCRSIAMRGRDPA
jgi:hypothetical protein